MVSQILIVMIAAIAVTIFAERRNIQAPLLLAAVGLAASFIFRAGAAGTRAGEARDQRKLDDEVMREVLEAMDFEQARWKTG